MNFNRDLNVLSGKEKLSLTDISFFKKRAAHKVENQRNLNSSGNSKFLPWPLLFPKERCKI